MMMSVMVDERGDRGRYVWREEAVGLEVWIEKVEM